MLESPTVLSLMLKLQILKLLPFKYPEKWLVVLPIFSHLSTELKSMSAINL